MLQREGGLPHLGVLRIPEGSVARSLVRRLALAFGLVALLTLILWIDRDGLRDNAHPDNPVGFVDVFYFTTVSLATVGYGDITPVTNEARLINALVLTPMRIFVWILFLGTAYEVTVLRFRLREDYRMRQLRERLDGHVIVCGFGVKGRAIVSELLAHHQPRDTIVVIDPHEDAVADAAKQDLVALRGDASSEAMLRHAVLDKAAYVLVAPDRDDACVLICLTVRNLNPRVQLIAAAREEENVKLLYHAGANLVIAPSVSGGRLMASAVRQRAVAQFLEDILSFGQGLRAAERLVGPDEVGRTVAELPDLRDTLIVGLARGETRYSFQQLPGLRLEAGDAIVYLTGHEVDAQ